MLSKRKALIALLLAPLAGLAFVVFLPVVGFLLTGKALLEVAMSQGCALRRKLCESTQKVR